MACYLKTNQFEECIKEGIEVLAADTRNVKALYRRGQAYKSLGQLENAVSDLEKALELSPDDETIADVLRDAKEKLNEYSGKDIQSGLKIEEITDEVPIPSSAMDETSSLESSSRDTKEIGKQTDNRSEYIGSLKDDKESIRSFQNFMSQADPDIGDSSSSFDMQEQIRSQVNNPAMREMMSSLMKNMSPDMMTNMSEQFGYKLSREDAERAQQAMSSLSPESLDKMMKWANRIQRITEGARNTKNWLLGRNGLVMAITMLLLAVFVHWLRYFGH